MSNHLEDEEFEKLVAEKQHEQFMLALKKLMKMIDTFDNKQLQYTLSKIDKTLDKLSNMDTSNNEGLKTLAQSLEKYKDVVFDNLSKINEKDDSIDQWTFNINRDSQGLITSVTAIKF